MTFPSIFLPSLPLSALLLLESLQNLRDFLFPADVIIDLRLDRPEGDNLAEVDAYELKYARNWCEIVLQFGTRALSRGMEEAAEAEMEVIVAQASNLIAAISGHCAAGSSSSTYLFSINCDTATDPPLRLDPLTSIPYFPIKIRNSTLLSDSTSFRTWGAASVLAAYSALHHQQLFQNSAKKSLKILELGSGTGLVGITIAAVLSALGRESVSITLSDFEDEENLQFNLKENEGVIKGVKAIVKHLDWSSFVSSPPSTIVKQQERFHLIFGADIIFEPLHLTWIHATVSQLLHFPTPATEPAFHVILQLRSTHMDQLTEFDKAFSDQDNQTRLCNHSVDENGVCWRLQTRSRKELMGGNGFGKGDQTYWLFDIRWIRC